MSWGRFFATTASTVAVAGCAVVVVVMSGAVGSSSDGLGSALSPSPGPASSAPSTPAALPEWTPSSLGSASVSAAAPVASAAAHPSTAPTTSAPPASVQAAVPAPAAHPTSALHAAPAPAPAPAPAVERGVSLPVGGTTSNATEVITVHATSYSSQTATLQAWRRASGGGWLRVGPAILAHVGSDGLSTSPSESKSATPIGSFTLTQAFGALADPGTPLPYFETTSGDWWISQAGPLYNTHQRCYSGCSFTQGDPNEHLRYETPFYNLAVVIDYNTRNSATGVRQGAGSAFFLHVTDGSATAGCVAIPQSNLVSIMRWLNPADHPRILIGVG